MKKAFIFALAMILSAALIWLVFRNVKAEWSGVDETVIERFAEQAGRSAKDPLINTDQGDLLLFVFLLAGLAGGFIGGYYFRELFPPRPIHLNNRRRASL